MNQYQQPCPQDYSQNNYQPAAPAAPTRKNGVFETSLPLLLLAQIVVAIVTAAVNVIGPLIASKIYQSTMSEKGFIANQFISPFIISVATLLCAFLICRSKKDAVMLLGLGFFVDSVFTVLTSVFNFFKNYVHSSVATIVTIALSALSFAVLIALTVCLSTGGKDLKRPLPESGYFSASRASLIVVAVVVTALCELLPWLVFELLSMSSISIPADNSYLYSAVGTIVQNVLFLAIILVFCFVKLRNIEESLLFFGLFQITISVTSVFSRVSSAAPLLGVMSAEKVAYIAAAITIVVSIALKVVLILLMTKKKAPQTAASQSYPQEQ